MSKFNVPIPQFGRYKLDLITQVITNKWGNVVSARTDKRGTVITNLLDDDGKQRTVNYSDMVCNTFNSIDIEPVTDSILSTVLRAYYDLITPETKDMALIEVSKLVQTQVPVVDILEIGRILAKLR